MDMTSSNSASRPGARERSTRAAPRRRGATRRARHLPLLDRLIDEAPEREQDAPLSPAEAMAACAAPSGATWRRC